VWLPLGGVRDALVKEGEHEWQDLRRVGEYACLELGGGTYLFTVGGAG
jgi:hypothetical protein